MCSKLFPAFSSISFSVSGFMWRSLIQLDLNFVQGDKNGSICILLHADHQLDQHHLLKMLSFFPLNGFSSFVKDQVTIGVWIHFWIFNSIPLILLPVSVPISWSFYHYCSVIQLEVRDGDSPRSSSIVENSFWYPGFFVFPNEFANFWFGWFFFCIVLFVSTLLTSALISIISCHLLLLGLFASFCSRAFRCAVKLVVYALSSFLLEPLRVFLLGLLSLCPISLGMLWLHFH